MRTGMRLTYIDNGDPLLGQTWEYQGETGVDAINLKVDNSFFILSKLKVTDVIDTIHVGLKPDGTLYLPNTGVNGDVWPLAERMDRYQTGLFKYNLELTLEVEFPTVVVDANWLAYAEYVMILVRQFPWVRRWQLMTRPEELDESGAVRCSPMNYHRLLKHVYETTHSEFSNVLIGGPGILSGITEYVDSAYTTADGDVFHTGWLAEAIGERYDVDPELTEIGRLGILEHLDFLAFQGRQDHVDLRYEVYPKIIAALREGITAQAMRSGVAFETPFFSTYQGHQADRSSFQDMQLQGFRDLREFCSAFAANVEPFKAQLVDEFFDETDGDPNNEKNVRGILYYYLGNGYKPSYQQFKFLLERLDGFTRTPPAYINLTNKRPYEDDDELEHITLTDDAVSRLVTVVFPRHERDVLSIRPKYQKIVLKAAMNRRYYLPDGNTGLILQPIDIELRNFDFVVVEESLKEDVELSEDDKAEIRRRLQLYGRYARELMSMIPSTYPHEVYDTNVYKLIRTVAVELGDAEFERGVLEDNMYLATAHGDAIWTNFGAMIGVKWQSRWTEEDYRRIVSGIIESLLNGATKASVQRAIQLFTNLDVHVYEMFTDYEHYGISKDENIDNQYRFTVEVEKTFDDRTDMSQLYDDVRYVTDIVRPAHTVPIVMIVVVGTEDYADWYEQRYGRPFAESDDVLFWPTLTAAANTYGWKLKGYDMVLSTVGDRPAAVTNGTLPIGPKYVLHERRLDDLVITWHEVMPPAVDGMIFEPITTFTDDFPPPMDEMIETHLQLLLREPRYGTRMDWDCLVYTNGGLVYDLAGNVVADEMRRLNSHHYGMGYFLRDEFWAHVQIFWNEVYAGASDMLEMWTQFYMAEQMPPPVEDVHVDLNVGLHELRFGYDPFTDERLMTSASPELDVNLEWRRTNRYLNTHRYGVRYRLADEPAFTLEVPSWSERFAPPIDQAWRCEEVTFVDNVTPGKDEVVDEEVTLTTVERFDKPKVILHEDVDVGLHEDGDWVPYSEFEQVRRMLTFGPSAKMGDLNRRYNYACVGLIKCSERLHMRVFKVLEDGTEVTVDEVHDC